MAGESEDSDGASISIGRAYSSAAAAPRGRAYLVVGGRLRPVVAMWRRLPRLLAGWASDEADRAALWTPVAIGIGVVVYFSLRAEPPAAAFLYPLAGTAGAWAFLRSRAAPRVLTLPVAAVAMALLGGLSADVRTSLVAAPRIERETPFVSVYGRLARLEEGVDRRRLTIEVSSIDGIDAENTPARVRVTWRGEEFDASPGEAISIRARLSPPPPPVAPDAFNFARQLFFERIGGVGFAVSPPIVLADAGDKSLIDHARIKVEAVRVGLARRIREAAPGAGGGIVAALVTGKRGGIDDVSEAALRDAGLAHLLAISGLHMGLAAGIVFFGVRLALAAAPPIALRFPIKKWAAAAALASLVGYLILSGSGWSSRRAFVMTGVLLVAILFDRRAISLRNVALAATIILLTSPEAVLHPGFQMSFAAATALIAAFGAARRWWEAPGNLSLGGRLRRYAIGVAATDTIAALATSPYGLYHFHRAAVYSLLGNLVATPIMAFWIMPAAVLGLVALPLGADWVFWKIAAAGVEAVLWTAVRVSGLEGAVMVAPQWPPIALGVVSLGGLWLCLAARPWRAIGAAAIVAGFVVASLALPADIFVAPDGDNVALRATDAEGRTRLIVASPRRDRFAQGVWMELSGLDPLADRPAALNRTAPCDRIGCVAAAGAWQIAVSEAWESLADDCARADLVIAEYPVSAADREACAAKLIDRSAAWRDGAHAVRFRAEAAAPGTIAIRSARDAIGDRPWSPN